MPQQITVFEQTFLDFIADRQLRVPRLRSSGEILDYASHGYGAAPADIEWLAASGHATLYSYVIYRQQYHPAFPAPYNVAHVELAEGPRLISTVIVENLATLITGMALQAGFDSTGRLVFVPAVDDVATPAHPLPIPSRNTSP